jgi:hypothetical protein
VFGEDTAGIRRQTRRSYLAIIAGAKDAPRVKQREDLATAIYGVHMATVLFWLIDQSPECQRTQQLLVFLRDLLKMVQPILWLPVVSQALALLAQIIGPLLGADDESLQTETEKKDEQE